MVAVSNGRMTIEHFHDLIHMKIDEKSKYIAPACGLFLASVEYERGVL
jgi:tRNA U38,U39,U40 pseudouridine synthase TruA